MGAWGSGIFENDGAGDWLADFEASGASMVDSALSDVLEAVSEGYIEIDVANAGLAAAEAVAIAFGKISAATDGDARAAVEDHEDDIQAIDNIARRATACVEAVVSDADSSEFVDLWQDAGSLDEATAVTDDLLARLGAIE